MTQTEAYKVLGLPCSASWSQVEEAYNKELARVQRQMVPGVPVARRDQAAVRLRELATALETLKASPQPHPRQFSRPPWTGPSPRAGSTRSPSGTFREFWNDLVAFWNDFAEIWPFSKTVLVLALILSLFAGLSFLGAGFRGRANVVATPASSAADARSEVSRGRWSVPAEPAPVAGH